MTAPPFSACGQRLAEIRRHQFDAEVDAMSCWVGFL
jgi:hypothetical protein